jgi:chloramphenicol O-acetyltransferase type B
MDGISISDGAIMATVTKNVLSYAILGGVTAKLIRFRFSDDNIYSLLNLRLVGKR